MIPTRRTALVLISRPFSYPLASRIVDASQILATTNRRAPLASRPRLERGASPQHGGNAGRDIAAAHARCVSCCATTPDRTLHRRRKDRAVMTLALLVEQLFNGVQFGLMLFLMAVGVTLVFGIMGVINLAHGSLFMLGGYFLMAALAWTRSYGLAIPLAFLGAALVAVVLEIVVLRPLYRRGPLDQVLATFGLTLFFNEAVTVIWGR